MVGPYKRFFGRFTWGARADLVDGLNKLGLGDEPTEKKIRAVDSPGMPYAPNWLRYSGRGRTEHFSLQFSWTMDHSPQIISAWIFFFYRGEELDTGNNKHVRTVKLVWQV